MEPGSRVAELEWMELEGWTPRALDRRPSLEVGGRHRGRHGAHCAVRTRAEEQPPGTALRTSAAAAKKKLGLAAKKKAGDRGMGPIAIPSAVRITISCSRRELGSNLLTCFGRAAGNGTTDCARGWRIGGDDDARLGRRRRMVGGQPAMALGW
jgi:hypothetical protein